MVIPTMAVDDLNMSNEVVQKILVSMDTLFTWVKVHEQVLERFETKKYFGYQ